MWACFENHWLSPQQRLHSTMWLGSHHITETKESKIRVLIDRGRVDKVMQNNTNFVVYDIKALTTMFNGVTKLGFPFLCDGNSKIYSKEEYMNKLNEKRIEEPMEKLEGIINGDQYIKRLRPSFHIWKRIKNIFN